MRRSLLACVIGCALTACGGGGSSDGAAESSSPSAAAETTTASPADRAAAEAKAKPWIARMQPRGPTPFDQTGPAPQQPAQTQTLAPAAKP